MRTSYATGAGSLRRRLPENAAPPPSPPSSPLKQSPIHSHYPIVAVIVIATIVAATAAVFLAVFFLRRNRRKKRRLPSSERLKTQVSDNGGEAIPSEQKKSMPCGVPSEEKSSEYRYVGTLARPYTATVNNNKKFNFSSSSNSKSPVMKMQKTASRRNFENESSVTVDRPSSIHPDPDPESGTITNPSSGVFGSLNLPVCDEIQLSPSPPFHSVSPTKSNDESEMVESPAKMSTSIHDRIEDLRLPETSNIPIALCSSSPDLSPRSSANSSPRNAEFPATIESSVVGSPERRSTSSSSSRNPDDSDQLTTTPSISIAAVAPKAYLTEFETVEEEYVNENIAAEISSSKIRITEQVQHDYYSAIIAPSPSSSPANSSRGTGIPPGPKPSVRPRALETRARAGVRPRALPSHD